MVALAGGGVLLMAGGGGTGATASAAPSTAASGIAASMPVAATQASTTGPSTTRAASRPALSDEAQLLLDATIVNTGGLELHLQLAIKEVQKDLASINGGIIQKKANAPDVERTVKANGMMAYRFNTPEARKSTLTKRQHDLEDAQRQLAEIRAGKLFIPSMELRNPVLKSAGSTDGARGKVLKVISGSQAILGYGANRFWVNGVTTEGWEEGKPAAFPALVAVTGETTYYEILDNETRPAFVMKAITPFNLEAEAAREKAEKAGR